MRKLLALLLLAPCISFAQGLYLKPEISAGFGNIKAPSLLHPKSVTAYKAGIGVGFELKRFRVETGIAYFKTGYRFTGLTFENNFDPLTGSALTERDINYHFQTIVVPIKAGYVFKVAKVKILPELGAAKLIITDGKVVDIDSKTGKGAKRPLRDYYKSNTLITAGVHVEIPIYKKLSVTAGPSFFYYLHPISTSGWREYACLLDAGVVYKF